MTVKIISFSRRGADVGERLRAGLAREGWQAQAFGKGRYMEDMEELEGEGWTHKIHKIQEPIGQWTGEQFSRSDALIFVGACGIAVRSIAPSIRHKTTDPAVVVVDERGRFAISLLSGHIGGGNDLALTAARIVGAQPVVTTATDLNGVFAVDVFAKQNGCHIADMRCAKEISARLLEGETVGVYSDFPWTGDLPRGLVPVDDDTDLEQRPRLGIAVTVRRDLQPFAQTLGLIPRVVTAGIGCKRGTSDEKIAEAVSRAAAQAGISLRAIAGVSSIDLKKDEPGLVAYCRGRGFPFETFSAEELRAVEGQFTPSSFVSSVTGVDNVCERSAVRASGGQLIAGKMAREGVTVAFAVRTWRPVF